MWRAATDDGLSTSRHTERCHLTGLVYVAIGPALGAPVHGAVRAALASVAAPASGRLTLVGRAGARLLAAHLFTPGGFVDGDLGVVVDS